MVLALIVLWRAASPAFAWGSLFNGGVLTLILVGGLGLFSLVAFDTFFVLFHPLFFVGDSWMFPYTDSLIQFYPEPFWVDAALGIALFTFVGALLLAGLAYRFKRPVPVKST